MRKHLSPENFRELAESLPGVVYCHVNDWAKTCIRAHLDPSIKVLVVSGGDEAMDDRRAELIPDTVARVFATNAITAHPKVAGIPLGLADSNLPHGKWENIVAAREVEIDKLLHADFAINTNRPVRSHALMVATVMRAQMPDQVTVRCYDSHVHRPLPHDEYLRIMTRHHYVLSPFGSGYDCHRTWEALYVGCVPIVEKLKELPLKAMLDLFPVEYAENMTPVLLDLDSERASVDPDRVEPLWTDYWRKRIEEHL